MPPCAPILGSRAMPLGDGQALTRAALVDTRACEGVTQPRPGWVLALQRRAGPGELAAANGEACKKQLHASFRFVGLAPAHAGFGALIVKDDQSGAPLVVCVAQEWLGWLGQQARHGCCAADEPRPTHGTSQIQHLANRPCRARRRAA
ncbi:hypothetical protein NA57DRAFT_58118 [Rhizodiscina lignyota]|uniref:Uncharacterized protein n=1 Tax=Rhizodiscina lignyota TaxID=1504668 RepID=A0A9P4M583_9PEZI|nr:hypothetical protein NA57DRAFT_58118 [Rhizodiscina lignyota]